MEIDQQQKGPQPKKARAEPQETSHALVEKYIEEEMSKEIVELSKQ